MIYKRSPLNHLLETWLKPELGDRLNLKMTLDLQKLREANVARCERAFHHKVSEWSYDDWFVALAGEYGEMCNVAKKMRRLDDGTNRAKDPQTREECIVMIGEELADCVIYLDLLMARERVMWLYYAPEIAYCTAQEHTLQRLCCNGHVLLSKLFHARTASCYRDFLSLLDAIAGKLGIDLSKAVVAKFDQVSRQRGCHIFLGPRKKCQPFWDSNSTAACRYFGADPDGVYCAHPKSLAESTGFGCSVDLMHRKGLCTHGEQGEYQLWEAPDEKSPT